MYDHASINRSFRLVWSAVRRCWVAVHERARGRGRGGAARSRTRASGPHLFAVPLLGAALAAAHAAPQVDALPSGGTLVAGQASWQQQGSTLQITQGSARAAIDWQSFNIGSGASVVFRQPDAQSVALNRVTGSQPSQIFGKLSANGQVFLVNSAGVYFSPTASANVGSLVASTHAISLDDFMAGRLNFSRNGSTGSVVNEGRLTAVEGGYIALLAPEVRNAGVITARAGTVALAAGEMIELQFSDGTLAKLRVSPSDVAALVENRQAVLAPDGQILMSARAAEALAGGVIRQDGQAAASSLTARGGRIVLEADQVQLGAGSRTEATGATGGGEINIGGNYQGQGPLYNAKRSTVAEGATLDASATVQGDGGKVIVWADERTVFDGHIAARGGALGGNGGFVETSGKQLLQVNTGRVDAGAAAGQGGTWLLDPNDLLISSGASTNVAESDGVFNAIGTGSVLNAAALVAALTNGSHVEVLTTTAGANAGTGTGTITIATDIIAPLQSRQTATLTLQAHGDIVLSNNAIIAAAGSTAGLRDRGLNLNLYAGKTSEVSGTGSIRTQGNTFIGTGTGDLNIVAADVTLNALGVRGSLNVNADAFVVNSFATVLGSSTLNIHGGQVSTPDNRASSMAGPISITGAGAVDLNLQQDAVNITLTDIGDLRLNAPFSPTNVTLSNTGSALLIVSAPHLQGSNTGDLTLTTQGNVRLDGLQVGGDLTVAPQAVSAGLHVTQTAPLLVGGNSSFDLKSGSLTLLDAGNRLSGAISATGTGTGSVQLHNAVDTVLGGTALGGDLSLTTDNKPVRQTQAIVAQDVAIDAGSAEVTLDHGDNRIQGDFGSLGSGAVFVRNSTDLTLQNIGSAAAPAASLLLQMRDSAGVFQASDSALSVSGSTAIIGTDIGAFVIDIGRNENRFGGPVRLQSDGHIIVRATGNLDVHMSGGAGNALAQTDGTLTATLDGIDNTLLEAPTVLASGRARFLSIRAGNVELGSVELTNDLVINATTAATQIGPLTVERLTLSGNGDFTLTHGQNSADRLSIAGGEGAIRYVNAGELTLQSTGERGGVISVAVVDGALLLANTLSTRSSAADAITLNAGQGSEAGDDSGGSILIANGSRLLTGTGGRATLYTGAVAESSGLTALLGSGSGRFRYGSDESTTAFTAALGEGLFAVYRESPTLTGFIPDRTQSYGDNSVNVVSLTGAKNGDLLAQIYPSGLGVEVGGALSSSGNPVVGTHTQAISNAGEALGYTIDGSTTTTLTVTPATIASIGGLRADKVYDGSTALVLDTSGAVFNGAIAGDLLTATGGSGSFADKNAGTGGPVTITGLGLGGADAGNYQLADSTANTTATITPRTLAAITGLSTADKVYDATTGAALITAGAVFEGVIAGDLLSVADGHAAFADKNAGTGKAVLVSGLSLGGTDAGNYQLADTTASATGNITPRALTSVTGITAADKVYDGSTALVLDTSGAVFNGAIAGDLLTATGGSGSFADKNAGTGKPVTITGLGLGGVDAGNYVLADSTANATATITPRTLAAVTGLSAAGKVYDATTSAALITADVVFEGAIAGDLLTVADGRAAFADKNAGTGKAVLVSGLRLGGADAGNYLLADTTASATGNITPRSLDTVSGIHAASKVYDATTAATLDASGIAFSGAIAGDLLTVGGASGSFADKNVGTGKAVSVVLSLGGADAGNYAQPAGLTVSADITPATIAAISGLKAGDKVYDATTAAALDSRAAVFLGAILGDALGVAGGSARFADKNAGAGKAVAVSGLRLDGADAGNYRLADSTAQATGTITPRTLAAVTGLSAADKVYDATTSAALITTGAVFEGAIAGDLLSVADGRAAFADKHAGTGKAVAVSGLSLGGADAGNYQLADTTGSVAGNITPRALTSVTGITAADKVYDATNTATLNTSGAVLTGVITGDALGVGGVSGRFADKNVGTDKRVDVLLSLGGADAGNYLRPVGLTAKADITPATLSKVTGIVAVDKLEDGNASAVLRTDQAAFVGIIAGDELRVVAAQGRFDDARPGVAKSVQISGIGLGGADAGNYQLADDSAKAQASIAPQPATARDLSPDTTRIPAPLGGGETVNVPADAERFIAGVPQLTEAAIISTQRQPGTAPVARALTRLLTADELRLGLRMKLPASLREAIESSGSGVRLLVPDGSDCCTVDAETGELVIRPGIRLETGGITLELQIGGQSVSITLLRG